MSGDPSDFYEMFNETIYPADKSWRARAEEAEAKLTAIREIVNKPTLLTDRYLRLLEIRRVLEETP
jgi:hypothetical protein